MARDSCPRGTSTVAVRVTRSIVTLSTLAGPSAAATKASASSDHGTMSTCSLASSLRIARCRTPLGPTQAPTGSSPGSLDDTAIFVRRPGSRAMARIWTVPALISGTSASSSRWTNARDARDTLTCACLRLCCGSRITTSTGRPGCSCSPGICSSGGITPSARPRSTYTVPASIRSTTPVASSPLCSATSRRTLSRSRSWMWRRTACLAVCAAIRLKSSDGSSCTSTVPSERTTRLRTSSAPVLVSSLTVSSPSGLNARLYAIASAPSTVWSISSNGMPSSLQSALSASDSVGVDGSDCDREPARDNVFPRDVNDHRRASASARRRHRDSRRVHRDQLSLDHRLRLPAAVAHVDALAVEPFVLPVAAERTLGTWRGHLQVVRAVDQLGVVQKRTHDPAHALAVLDRDRLAAVDGNSQRSTGVTGLVEGVELVTHVVERGLEQLLDRRYGPGRHVRCVSKPYRRG